jgi:hypothetical protein
MIQFNIQDQIVNILELRQRSLGGFVARAAGSSPRGFELLITHG